MKQILHIFNDGVYAGPEKPEKIDYMHTIGNLAMDERYEQVLEDWQSACMKVTNSGKSDNLGWHIIDGEDWFLPIENGQLAETKIEDGKKYVTKLY